MQLKAEKSNQSIEEMQKDAARKAEQEKKG